MVIDKDELRRVMGHFATGVTVITTCGSKGEPRGLTANAFTSVSLVPPLLLVCVDKNADSHPCIKESGIFTVNILAQDQETLSRKFAVSGTDKFQGVPYTLGKNGAAILDGVLAHIECQVTAAYEAGDHTIYLGEVQHAHTREGKPLLFFGGSYRVLGNSS